MCIIASFLHLMCISIMGPAISTSFERRYSRIIAMCSVTDIQDNPLSHRRRRQYLYSPQRQRPYQVETILESYNRTHISPIRVGVVPESRHSCWYIGLAYLSECLSDSAVAFIVASSPRGKLNIGTEWLLSLSKRRRWRNLSSMYIFFQGKKSRSHEWWRWDACFCFERCFWLRCGWMWRRNRGSRTGWAYAWDLSSWTMLVQL